MYFRTINVKFTARDHTLGAIISGAMTGILWLSTTFMGVSSFKMITSGDENGYFIASGHILGGVVGTYIGMRLKVSKKRSKRLNTKS